MDAPAGIFWPAMSTAGRNAGCRLSDERRRWEIRVEAVEAVEGSPSRCKMPRRPRSNRIGRAARNLTPDLQRRLDGCATWRGLCCGRAAAAIKRLSQACQASPRQQQERSESRGSVLEINSANEIIGDEDKRKQFDRGEIDADAGRASRVFRRRPARTGRFETHIRTGAARAALPAAAAAVSDISTAHWRRGAGARPGGGGTTFEFDTGIALDLDLSVAMTVSLEEAANGVEKRVWLPTGKGSMSRSPPESRRVSRSG